MLDLLLNTLAILVPLWIIYKIVRRVGLNFITYNRYFGQIGVFQGSVVTLFEEINSRYFMPLTKVDILAYLRIELRLPGVDDEDAEEMEEDDDNDDEDDENETPDVNPMQRFISRFTVPSFTQVRRSIKINCLKRGFYRVESVKICGKESDSPAMIYVYPAPLADDEHNPLVNALQTTVATDRRLFMDPFSFAGIRDYRPGDTFKMINYKASAKTGAVIVNQREFVTSRNIMLYMDFSLLPSPETISTKHYHMLMEKGLSYAADMVFKAIDQGYNVGFAANCRALGFSKNPTHIRFPMQSGHEHYINILQELASVSLFEGVSFLWLVKQDVDALRDADVYIMTCNKERDMDEVTDMLRARNNSVSVVRL